MGDVFPLTLVILVLLTVLLFRSLGKTVSGHLRRRRATQTQARRHLVKAASLLAEARSGKLTSGEARASAGNAINEADIAIELDPVDAAILIVKSLALEYLKKPVAALKVLDSALSKKFSKSLTGSERADTLSKRAELMLGQMKGNSRDGKMQDVLLDLQESTSLKPSNARTHFMLGTCCEKIGDGEDALVAYRRAVVVDPSYSDAKAALRDCKALHLYQLQGSEGKSWAFLSLQLEAYDSNNDP